MAAYAFTIFLGAFLLFEVQPLIAKYILPWFGGGPGVWTTCMLFFQMALLAGYAYAHALCQWLKPAGQITLHLMLLGAAVALLPIIPGPSWKPRADQSPVFQIIVLLAANIGAPYFMLSATGPLLQQWFTRTYSGVSPYRLYALSNAGSLLALLSYPLFFETRFTRKSQATIWAYGLVLYAFGCGICGFKRWRAEQRRVQPGQQEQSSPKPDSLRKGDDLEVIAAVPFTRLLWLLWPACGSVLLLAITNKICQDIAVVPFLWVLPLSLYLLSFIICFDSPRWYKPAPYTLALVAALAALAWALFKGSSASLRVEIGAFLFGLFICCLVCHGELAQLKPGPNLLTQFYLMIALGGALGGLFVALAAPRIFTSYLEVPYGLLLCALLAVFTRSRKLDPIDTLDWRRLACALTACTIAGLDFSLVQLQAHAGPTVSPLLVKVRIGVWVLMLTLIGSWIARKKFRSFHYWKLIACTWLWLGWVALAVILWVHGRSSDPDIVYMERNFYGVLKVFEHDKDKPLNHHFLLQHGRITHGVQFADTNQSTWPTTYYSEQSGIGLAIAALGAGPRRIGVVGLGAGTLATYGRVGDSFRFYEINPEVTRVAETLFNYLSNCASRVEMARGDARLSLESEPAQNFDLLALDAFSSDAIPVHLLTREAFLLYERHVKNQGVIAVHVSNHYLDLEPVVINLAVQFNYHYAIIDFDEMEDEWWKYANTWILLTHNQAFLQAQSIRLATTPPEQIRTNLPLWTDDFASLIQILK